MYGDVQTRSVSNLSYKGSAFVDNTVDCRRESALCAPEKLFRGRERRRSKECRGNYVKGRGAGDGMLLWGLFRTLWMMRGGV